MVRDLPYSQNEILAEIIHSWDFGLLWNKLYKKEYITFRFNEEFKIREDLLFNSEYFKNVKNIGFVCDFLYNYFDNTNSLTKSTKSIPFEQLKATHLNMISMLSEIDESLISHQNTSFLKSLINVLKPFVYTGLRKEDKQKIKEILNDKTIQLAFKDYKTVDIKEKAFIFLLKHKKLKTLLFFIKLMK